MKDSVVLVVVRSKSTDTKTSVSRTPVIASVVFVVVRSKSTDTSRLLMAEVNSVTVSPRILPVLAGLVPVSVIVVHVLLLYSSTLKKFLLSPRCASQVPPYSCAITISSSSPTTEETPTAFETFTDLPAPSE